MEPPIIELCSCHAHQVGHKAYQLGWVHYLVAEGHNIGSVHDLPHVKLIQHPEALIDRSDGAGTHRRGCFSGKTMYCTGITYCIMNFNTIYIIY